MTHPQVRRTVAVATAAAVALSMFGVSVTSAPSPAGADPSGNKHANAKVKPVKGANWIAPKHAVKAMPKAPVRSRTLTGTRTARIVRQHGQWVNTGFPGVQARVTAPDATLTLTTTVLSPASMKAMGSDGLGLRLTATGGDQSASDGGPIDLRISRGALSGVGGADFADRVTWRQVVSRPGAVTPSASQLRTARAKRESDGTWTVTAALPAAISPSQQAQSAPARSTTLVATSSATSSSGTGDFSATSLRSSSSWQVSAQTGSFAWSYPFSDIPVADGPAPNMSLSYDSGSVDGETGSSNNQPGEVGDGWSLSGLGFVERSYKSCSKDGQPNSGDECWSGDNATMSFGGHSGHLVRIGSSDTYRLEGDDGSRIEHKTGADNGDGGSSVDGTGEYWVLTTTDGTQYYFGRGHVPGKSAATNAAWTVPVYGDDAGEPCHDSTFAASRCTDQTYRWNLDYVVTLHGQTSGYYYDIDTNRYAANGGTPASYIRGGALSRIEYGTSTSDTGNAPARMTFDLADRCVTASCATHDQTNWPDTPWDLQCSTGDCSGHVSPSFFSTKRVAAVHTQILSGTTYNDVNRWVLTQSYPDPGDGQDAALWLSRISSTGYSASGSQIARPDTVMHGFAMPNRVHVIDGLPLLWKYRISSIETDTGASVAVNYSTEDCNASSLPSPQTNDKRCYPSWWSPADNIDPQLDWFNKYVVTSVVADPRTGGGGPDPAEETAYTYSDPGWRYDRSVTAPSNRKTWSDFAGFRTVRVLHGYSADPASRENVLTTYFRGLDGDRKTTAGDTKDEHVTASDGSSVTDSLWFAGQARESTTYNGSASGAARISNTITTPWASAATASDGSFTARLTGTSAVVTSTAVAGKPDRLTKIATAYDSRGRVASVSDLGDVATAADDRCTTTSYAENTSSWLLNLPSDVEVTGAACGATLHYPADAVSHTRNLYDGHPSFLDAPTRGDVTETVQVAAYAGTTAGSATWSTTQRITNDDLGRPLTETDPRTSPARTTSHTYTPAAAGIPTSSTVSTPDPSTGTASWKSTTSLNPSLGVPTHVVDKNGHVTDATYDALGRLTAVWLPQRPKADNTVPSQSFSYNVPVSSSNVVNGPLAAATTSLTPSGGTITSYALMDGLGRDRQTQSPAVGGGRIITDTTYDTAGRVAGTNSAYYATGNPGSILFVPATVVPGITGNVFDGAGRKTAEITYVNGNEAWRTSTAYYGDHTTATPPIGGTKTSTYTDAHGQAVELRQYHSLAAGDSRSEYDSMTYTYNARGDQTTVTDNDGNVWRKTFDALGQLITESDPDTGTTTNSYDDAGRLIKTVSAPRNSVAVGAPSTTLVHAYDLLDRPIADYENASTGTKLADWTYDPAGHLGSTVAATSHKAGRDYITRINAYDNADRPTSSSTVIPQDPTSATRNALAGTYTATVSYTANGLVKNEGRTAVGNIAAEAIAHSYDEFGHELRVAGSGTGYAQDYVTTATYTSLGELAQYTAAKSATSLTRSFTYADGTRRLSRDLTTTTAASNATAADHTYTYNPAGFVTRDQDSTPATGTDTQCYIYDYVQRLTEAWTPSNGTCSSVAPTATTNLGGPAPYWTSYTYSNGQRRSMTQHSSPNRAAESVTMYTYGPTGTNSVRPHAVVNVQIKQAAATVSSVDYQYDGAGDTLTKTDTIANATSTFAYDGYGHLSTTQAGAAATQNVYDASGNRLIASDGAGSTLYLGDTELRSPESAPTTLTATRTYTFAGASVAERVGPSAINWLITDHHGTALAEVKVASNAVVRRHHDPFGNTRDAGTQIAWSSSRGFLNAPTDAAVGTVHLGARDYDPSGGKFLTVDPVLHSDDPQQNSGYDYSANDPINRSDPSGLDGPVVCSSNCNALYGGHNSAPAQTCFVQNGGDSAACHASSPAPAMGSGGPSGGAGGNPPGRSHSGLGTKLAHCKDRTCIKTQVADACLARYSYGCSPALDTEQQLALVLRPGSGNPLGFLAVFAVVASLVMLPETLLACRLGGCALATAIASGDMGAIDAFAAVAADAIANGGVTAAEIETLNAAPRVGGATAVRIGQAGEAAVRASYDIGPKAAAVVDGRRRIFDGLTGAAVTEVKNVNYQAYTQQLKDSLTYAQQTSRRFDLYVRGGENPTKLSGPLQDAVRDGQIKLLEIP